MEMRRCNAGLHMYDAEKFSTCPYCANTAFDFGDSEQADVKPIKPESKPTRKVEINENNLEQTGRQKATVAMGSKSSADAQRQTGLGEVNIMLGSKTKVMRTDAGVRPVTAWLVVVAGPGKGRSFPVFMGMNSIGRDKLVNSATQQEQEICLDFGAQSDPEVSRHAHAKLTYDKKGNHFYLQHGGGNSLTYLNNQPVLEPQTLKAYDQITLGKTQLLFMPLCGDQFQWPADEH